MTTHDAIDTITCINFDLKYLLANSPYLLTLKHQKN